MITRGYVCIVTERPYCPICMMVRYCEWYVLNKRIYLNVASGYTWNSYISGTTNGLCVHPEIYSKDDNSVFFLVEVTLTAQW